jgi:hypothetical protein
MYGKFDLDDNGVGNEFWGRRGETKELDLQFTKALEN